MCTAPEYLRWSACGKVEGAIIDISYRSTWYSNFRRPKTDRRHRKMPIPGFQETKSDLGIGDLQLKFWIRVQDFYDAAIIFFTSWAV
jgi:hypothetical protein